MQHPHWPVAGPYGAPVVVEEEDHQCAAGEVVARLLGSQRQARHVRRGPALSYPSGPPAASQTAPTAAALPRLRAQGETEVN